MKFDNNLVKLLFYSFLSTLQQKTDEFDFLKNFIHKLYSNLVDSEYTAGDKSSVDQEECKKNRNRKKLKSIKIDDRNEHQKIAKEVIYVY